MAFNNKVATASQLWFLSFKVSEVLATEKKIKDEKAINKFTNTYKRWIYGILMHDLKRYEEGKIKKFLSYFIIMLSLSYSIPVLLNNDFDIATLSSFSPCIGK